MRPRPHHAHGSLAHAENQRYGRTGIELVSNPIDFYKKRGNGLVGAWGNLKGEHGMVNAGRAFTPLAFAVAGGGELAVGRLGAVAGAAGAAEDASVEAMLAGQRAHIEIQDGYLGLDVGWKREVRIEGAGRADLVNHETLEVIEIKRNNPRGLADGSRQLERYLEGLRNQTGRDYTGYDRPIPLWPHL